MKQQATATSRDLRPRDFALLLLASGDLRPRRRARDQQADAAGLELKRRLLDRLATLNPEPSELASALVRIVEEIGPPTGPTRAIACVIVEEWETACLAPEWLAHLLNEAARNDAGEQRRGP